MSDDEGEAREERRDRGRGDEGERRPRLLSLRVLLLVSVVGVVLLSSPFWGPLVMRRMAFFRVRRVEILGAHYVAPGDILSRLHVDTTASIWGPTKPLVARVSTHPEIQSAVVRRKLPGTLVVEIVERI